MSQADLDELLDPLPAATRRLVRALRGVVRRAVPQTEESFVWGGLSYHLPEVGGRVKGAVCQIHAKRGRVRLDFIHGIRLPDPHGLLQGAHKSKRFVRINTVAEAERPEIEALIRAAALVPAGWT